MSFRDTLINKIDTFMTVVVKSIDAEVQILPSILRAKSTKDKKELLSLMIKMQEVNGDRIKMLESLLDRTMKKINEPVVTRTHKKKSIDEYRSKKLVEKYDSKLESDIDDKVGKIAQMLKGR